MVQSLLYRQGVENTIKLDVIGKLDIKKLVGSNLRRTRNERGLTQDALGAMLDPPVNGSHIASIEAGKGISDDVLSRICNALGVQPWEFYLTDEAPLIVDALEQRAVQMVRDAAKEHLDYVAEEAIEYTISRVKTKKKEIVKLPSKKRANSG